ncbi:MAG TPA: transglutaminase domain-containing protein [Solirubrobacteraceae bacterium]|nr:transglutaminase domain-containing protein [Solirubrobacteraceae bacterium]
MSSTTQVAVLAPLGQEAGSGRPSVRGAERPFVRLIGFAALALYGVVRWGTLMSPAPTWRLLGLLALAVALVGVAPVLLEREREVAARAGRSGGGPDSISAVGAPLAVLAILAAFPLAGVPLAWIVHLRVAVTANGIGSGLSALPGILVPYSGINEWARIVMNLGAAVLLLDAAMLLAFAPPQLGDVRRAGAALPLIALVVVPATLVHPNLPYEQGLLLFGLLAFFMWGDRVPADRRGGVVLICLATGATGLILAPALDEHSPWINYEALTRGLTPAHVDRFNWTQGYGPLNWPHSGNNVLSVSASPAVFSGEYWKTENLDTFDGSGWVTGGPTFNGGPASASGLPGVSLATFKEFTQTLTVTISAMRTTQVVAAGYAPLPPDHLNSTPQQGTSVGTWVSPTALGPGDTYTVKVYVPHPTTTQLEHVGDGYPAQVQLADLTVGVPQPDGKTSQTILFPAFGSHGRVSQEITRAMVYPAVGTPRLGPLVTTNGSRGQYAIRDSPYAQAYAEAQKLARGARTPYAFVQRVLNYLSAANGFSYNQNPPRAQYPLATFLIDKIGYCQQFAGEMALLLRMGGVPARVATGFTTGTYDSATKKYLVADIDAHAWVEAWFPHYGWVTFDPTPASAPARGGGSTTVSAFSSFSTYGEALHARAAETPIGTAAGHTTKRAKSSGAPLLLGAVGVLLVLIVVGLVAWRRTGGLDSDALLAELERALARSGRPVSEGVTLAALERRFRTSPDAAAYIRALRLSRFGTERELPTLNQRRALRAQLRAGLGLGAALRSLWALPPRPKRHRRHGRRRSAGVGGDLN